MFFSQQLWRFVHHKIVGGLLISALWMVRPEGGVGAVTEEKKGQT